MLLAPPPPSKKDSLMWDPTICMGPPRHNCFQAVVLKTICTTAAEMDYYSKTAPFLNSFDCRLMIPELEETNKGLSAGCWISGTHSGETLSIRFCICELAFHVLWGATDKSVDWWRELYHPLFSHVVSLSVSNVKTGLGSIKM